MRHLHILTLMTAFALSACGASDDPAPTQDAVAPVAADAPVEDDYEAWLKSDARPVNLACNEPSFRRGQPETAVALHSPLYPAIQARQKRLKQRLRDLTPQVTDTDMHDAEAYNAVVQKVSILSQFVFLMTVDTTPRSPLILCDHEQFESTKCQLMVGMMGKDYKVENAALDGDALSFASMQVKERLRSDVRLANRDQDTVTLNITEGGAPIFQGEWTRDETGTERLAATAQGASYAYAENPDCSGEAAWSRTRDSGSRWDTTFRWTSTKDDSFSLSFRECLENDLGEMDCTSGGL